MRPFPLIKQQKIVVATTALHNFIRMCDYGDEEFDKCDNTPGYMSECEHEMNINEEVGSCNTRRAIDGGYMDRVRH